jgi:AcrR family transcriptional regulator
VPRLRRAEQVQRNRELVLEAARRVFLAKGYAGATLDAIADEAGFSKGVVYSQFESKGDLFLTLLDRRIDDRAAENEKVTSMLELPDALRALVRAAERDSQLETAWSRVLIEFRILVAREPALNRRYAVAHARTVKRLADLLHRLHVRTKKRPAFGVEATAELVIAFGHGVTLERAANPAALPTGIAESMLLKALGVER